MVKEEMLRKIAIVLSIVGISLIIIGILTTLLEMYIQNQCFQLEPSEFYNSTICEKYWEDTNWNFLKEWKSK